MQMRSSQPTVSVLIPVYNREIYIGACIESALNQTFRDIEVVIVDNASTDRTWECVQKYAARDVRVRVFQNPRNLGPVENWRRCLKEARGRLGKLLFSDDVIYPEYLTRTVPLLEDPDVGFAFSAMHIGSEIEAEMPIFYSWERAPQVVSSRRFIEDVLLDEPLPLSPGAAIFRIDDLRRNLLERLPSPTVDGFTRTGAGVDLLCYLLTAKDYEKVSHVPEPLGLFRSHPNSISTAGGEVVVRQYAQARIWFAQRHCSRKLFLKVVVLAWFGDCRRAGRFVSYRGTVRRYIVRPPAFPVLTILQVGWEKRKWVKHQMFSAFKDWLRAVHTTYG